VEKAFLPLLLLYLLLGCARQASGPPLHGGRIEPARAAANFALTDQDGKPFALDSTRGKVVLLYFGYTSCPDVCPTTLSDMAAAREQLGADANQVQVVFVTVDPERDTQEVLKRYVPAFDASFTGLRGSADTIKQVADAYGVKYKKTPLANSALGYAVDHSAFVYVIDRTGRLRELFPFGTSREDITSDLRVLLTEGAY
jgi:protein SCO1/2